MFPACFLKLFLLFSCGQQKFKNVQIKDFNFDAKMYDNYGKIKTLIAFIDILRGNPACV
jgi:hypothetical protein